MTTPDGAASPRPDKPGVPAAPPAAEGSQVPVVLGQIDESFHQVGGGVVHETLLRLGHVVDIREGPHPEIYPLLGEGELHLFATSWLPGGHAAYWQPIRGRALQVSPLYDGARFFWAVPDYVPADQVAALPDLARPEVIRQMATLTVQGTTPGAGLTARSRQLVVDYGLEDAGWSYQVGNLGEIIRTVNARMTAREWFVTPLWQPQYLNEVHPLWPLDDPRGVFPASDQAWLTANRAAFERLPERTQGVLRQIRFSLADATAMDYAVNVDCLSPRQRPSAGCSSTRTTCVGGSADPATRLAAGRDEVLAERRSRVAGVAVTSAAVAAPAVAGRCTASRSPRRSMSTSRVMPPPTVCPRSRTSSRTRTAPRWPTSAAAVR
jgi:glycine betaine/proline transport system substrate-binding protein